MSNHVDYRLVIRDFDTDFGKGDIVEIIENAHHLSYAHYVNDVGEMFFTMSQEDPKVKNLINYIDKMAHAEVWRNGELVWAGWLGEFDETYEDVIIYAYSYLSGFYYLMTDWQHEWTDANVSTIFTDLLTRATGFTNSRVAWLTEGTIQNPVTTSDGATGLTMPFYRVNYKRILQVYKELAAYAISDTTNHVIFEVTPDGTFNLWKDRETVISDIRWRIGPGGIIRSYRRLRVPLDRRTRLDVVGSSPIDVTLKTTVSDSTLEESIGRLEEPIYLDFVRDSTELTRVSKIRLKRAKRVDTDLSVTFYQNAVIPSGATGAAHRVGDTVKLDLERGISNVSENKLITGEQVVFYRKAENVRLLLADAL